MQLLGSTKDRVTEDESGENVPHLEFTEVVLIYCNIVKKNYQHDSIVLNLFVPDKSFGQQLDILTQHFIFLESFNSYIEAWSKF